MRKFLLLMNTLRYLRAKQVWYRLYYSIRRKFKNNKIELKSFENPSCFLLNFQEFLKGNEKYKNGEFKFLNLSKKFNEVDWNFSGFGKLWVYNLNYFDFLNQKSIKLEEALSLIKHFISKIEQIEIGLEPYPTSLRTINWIKFLSANRVKNKEICIFLYAQYKMLLKNLEYHLMGNHLLENGFSLLFGAYFFRNEFFYNKAKEILLEELEEQVLSDGGHFEQSPMYHQIILERLLDAINLIKNNSWKGQELLEILCEKAEKMLGWLREITFANGNIPLFNDSAFGIAFSTEQLLDYAMKLGLKPADVRLGDSGYRMIRKGKYEIAIDIGDIKAKYIPGHSHADTFTFELYINNTPIVVDTGVSTYENNKKRILERSTKAHNTVEVNEESSSEVWGSFRVGGRAKVVEVEERKDYVRAIHDGYFKKFGVFHQREYFFKENEIVIKDKILGGKRVNAVARLHFHPKVEIESKEKFILMNNFCKIEIEGGKFKIVKYEYAPEFNKLIPGKCVEIFFQDKLECKIGIC